MNIASLAGHLAFGLIAFSFLVKDIFWLRVLSILASLFSVLYNYIIPVEPMWLAINWNFIFVSVNLYHIAVILYEKREIKMDEKNEELYTTLFKEMTPVEYLKISRAAQWKVFKSGEVITREQHLVQDLVLVYNGTVDVVVTSEFEDEAAAAENTEPNKCDVKITEYKIENTKWKKGGLANE